jgi:hypothetical protein
MHLGFLVTFNEILDGDSQIINQTNENRQQTPRVICDKYRSIKNNFGIYSHTLHNRINKQTNKKEFQHSPRLTINQLIHVLQFPKVVQSLLVPVA